MTALPAVSFRQVPRMPAASPAVPHADLVNVIRALAMDAVQKANSGHPGMPMGMADIAEVLWRECCATTRRTRLARPRPLRAVERPRLDAALRAAAPLGLRPGRRRAEAPSASSARARPATRSTTPTPGVETTTGPLGQGSPTRSAWRSPRSLLAAEFNRPGHTVVDHHTYVFLGDGCLMEGISHEACSLAGTLGLGKLVVLYDDNGISIDGEVEGWFTDDTPKRFAAYGWHVIPRVDGHDPKAIAAAIAEARADDRKPHADLLQDRDRLGRAQQAGHGHARRCTLGADKEIAATREAIGWPHAPFVVPPTVRPRGTSASAAAPRREGLEARFAAYEGRIPELASRVRAPHAGPLPPTGRTCASALLAKAPRRPRPSPPARHRRCLEAIGPDLPELLGGSADLTGSNNTGPQGFEGRHGRPGGNYVSYGVREFGMTAIGTAWRCTAASSPTAAPSSCSPTTRATPCAWRR
jgi:transketolase